jgi:signal transduction histidine kinase
MGEAEPRSGGSSGEVNYDEIVRRGVAIALGTPLRRGDIGLGREAMRRISDAEERALALAEASGPGREGKHTAALAFLADALATLVIEHAVPAGTGRDLVTRVAAATDRGIAAATVEVFLRALASHEAAQLPPKLAMSFSLELLTELGPAEHASLWTQADGGRLVCAASTRDAGDNRRDRAAARAHFDGDPDASSRLLRVAGVERWEVPFAALVVRCRADASEQLDVFIVEATVALTPLFEREMLFERNATRERLLVAGIERRLTRLGFDLHDGPLQDLVALADDLRLMRAQVGLLLKGPEVRLLDGRFDDLDARLAGLDRGLRDMVHSVRSTSALDVPLEEALRQEVEALNRTAEVEVELAVDGDISALTASQRIALFRVVQESLSNIRKHSAATRGTVRLRSGTGYVSIAISDNGCGFELASAREKGRFGLAGVVERVRLLGGDVEIQSRPGEGVQVQATLPRWQPSDEEPGTPLYAVTA